MAEKRLTITKVAIDGLPPAAKGKRAYYYDTKAKGLVVAVTDRGTKSFLVYRWVSGRPKRITLRARERRRAHDRAGAQGRC